MAHQSGVDTFETPEARNERFSSGEISEGEIQEYLKHPEGPLFTTEKPFPVSVAALTSKNYGAVLQAVKESWEYESDFEAMRSTFDALFEQEKSGVPGLLNPEYYLAMSNNGEIIAITGIYSVDIQGGRGFATREKSGESHYLNARIGWTSVRKDMQGKGLAGLLIDWVEGMAKARGATHVLAEVDDLPSNEKMRQRYERHGYTSGFQINNYFGPERHLRTYVLDMSGRTSELSAGTVFREIQANDSDSLRSLASQLYSSERLDEFNVCLDLFLRQENNKGILQPHSIDIRNTQGQSEAFALVTESIIYPNILEVHWYGAQKGNKEAADALFSVLAQLSTEQKREIVVFYSDGDDTLLQNQGCDPLEGGIPKVWRDHTEQLLYSKRIN